MNDDEAADVFLGTMDDLAYSSRYRAGEYEAARAAALTRRLLFDQKSLYDRVARGRNLSFSAEIGELTVARELALGDVWTRGALIDPTINRVGVEQIEAVIRGRLTPDSELVLTTRTVDRDGLARTRVAGLFRSEQVATVRDLVRLYANHLGGVHLEMEKSPNELLLALREHDPSLVRQMMLAVGRVVHRALDPLATLLTMEQHKDAYGVWGQQHL